MTDLNPAPESYKSSLPPKTPQFDDKAQLGFKREKMVGWLDPGQLISTGIRTLLATIFGTYLDKRESEAAFPHRQHQYGLDKNEELWFDYVADLGDGWNSTYAIARLLAEQELSLPDEGSAVATKRGTFLVMGGDQVYPTASREEYANRLEGPYRSALPWVKKENPHLFAIPGNHDWYDGLTSFLRLFGQERWIGAWKTRQSRSYFAIKLPHNLWLWGIDTRLASDIDKPQLDYFREVAKKNDIKGHKIILCTPEPTWIYTKLGKPEDFSNLAFFEKKIINENGAELVVTIAGDKHHYNRYKQTDGIQQKITCGGGGAYMSATHLLPNFVELGESKTDDKKLYSLASEPFPSKKRSKGLTWRALLLPIKNWRFWLFLGSFYLVFAWILQIATKSAQVTYFELASGKALSFFALLWKSLPIIFLNPSCLILFLVFVFGFVGVCDTNRKYLKLPVGIIHAILHTVLLIFLIRDFLYLNSHISGFNLLDQPSFWQGFFSIIVFVIEMVAIGGFLGSMMVGIYFVLTHRFFFLLGEMTGKIYAVHTEKVFASRRIEGYKSFLRIKLDKEGMLTVFAIGLQTVCKEWELNKEAQNGQSLFVPKPGHKSEPHLIEKIEIKLA